MRQYTFLVLALLFVGVACQPPQEEISNPTITSSNEDSLVINASQRTVRSGIASVIYNDEPLEIYDKLCWEYVENRAFCDAPTIVPIGWSEDGKFACQMTFGVYDMKNMIHIVDEKGLVEAVDQDYTLLEAESIKKFNSEKNALLEKYNILTETGKVVMDDKLVTLANNTNFRIEVENDLVETDLDPIFMTFRKCAKATVSIAEEATKIQMDEVVIQKDKDGEYSDELRYIGYAQHPETTEKIVVFTVNPTFDYEGDDHTYKPHISYLKIMN